MEETALRHPDLLNLTRWVSLAFLLLLIVMPQLHQLEGETQPGLFETSQLMGTKGQTGDILETKLFFQKGGRLASGKRIFPAQGLEWDMGVPLMSVLLGPVVPGENQSNLLLPGLVPKPAGMHVSILLSAIKPESESKNAASPGLKEEQEHPFESIIHRAAERYEVDPALVKAIIMAESSYNPRAVSKKGARGLMQLMPRTAKALGVKNSFDPKHNIDAGVRYFRQLLDQFDGDVKLAIAAYNAGSRKVRKYNGIPPFKDTRYYVAKVIEYHKQYQQ